MYPVDRNYLFAAVKANGGMHRCTSLPAFRIQLFLSKILFRRSCKEENFFFSYLRIMDFNDLIINPILRHKSKTAKEKKNYGYIENFKLRWFIHLNRCTFMLKVFNQAGIKS